MNSVQGGKAKCPYFRAEEKDCGKVSISCEGVGRCVSTKLYFRTAKELTEHKRLFCNDKYSLCALAKAINREYEGD